MRTFIGELDWSDIHPLPSNYKDARIAAENLEIARAAAKYLLTRRLVQGEEDTSAWLIEGLTREEGMRAAFFDYLGRYEVPQLNAIREEDWELLKPSLFNYCVFRLDLDKEVCQLLLVEQERIGKELGFWTLDIDDEKETVVVYNDMVDPHFVFSFCDTTSPAIFSPEGKLAFVETVGLPDFEAIYDYRSKVFRFDSLDDAYGVLGSRKSWEELLDEHNNGWQRLLEIAQDKNAGYQDSLIKSDRALVQGLFNLPAALAIALASSTGMTIGAAMVADRSEDDKTWDLYLCVYTHELINSYDRYLHGFGNKLNRWLKEAKFLGLNF